MTARKPSTRRAVRRRMWGVFASNRLANEGASSIPAHNRRVCIHLSREAAQAYADCFICGYVVRPVVVTWKANEPKKQRSKK